MATDIEEGANGGVIFTNDDDLFRPDLVQEIVAPVGDARHVARNQPFAADDLIHIRLKHRIGGVKFLIKTIADAGIGREATHQLGRALSH